jgi:hypothetical protein
LNSGSAQASQNEINSNEVGYSNLVGEINSNFAEIVYQYSKEVQTIIDNKNFITKSNEAVQNAFYDTINSQNIIIEKNLLDQAIADSSNLVLETNSNNVVEYNESLHKASNNVVNIKNASNQINIFNSDEAQMSMMEVLANSSANAFNLSNASLQAQILNSNEVVGSNIAQINAKLREISNIKMEFRQNIGNKVEKGIIFYKKDPSFN